jgi:hypothetical protein
MMARCTARRGPVNRVAATGWPDGPAWASVRPDGRDQLGRVRARPHWGKLFLADAAAIAPLYPRRHVLGGQGT